MRLLSIIVFTVVLISNTFGQTTPTTQVKTIDDLVALRIPSINNRLSALVTGRVTENDGGGGVFFYDGASVVTTNLGTVFKPAASDGRWLRQYGGELNVKWFGAVGDGATDDVGAFRSAYTVLSSVIQPKLQSGGTLYIPTGTYAIGSTITNAVSKAIRLRGDGNTSVLLWTGAAGGSILHVTSTGGTATDIQISNLLFQPDTSNQANSVGITFGDVAGAIIMCKVTECYFNYLDTAIVINNEGDEFTFSDNWFFACGKGLLFQTDGSTSTSNHLITGNHFQGLSNYAVDVENGGFHDLIGNTIQSAISGGNGVRYDSANSINILGNYFEFSGAAVPTAAVSINETTVAADNMGSSIIQGNHFDLNGAANGLIVGKIAGVHIGPNAWRSTVNPVSVTANATKVTTARQSFGSGITKQYLNASLDMGLGRVPFADYQGLSYGDTNRFNYNPYLGYDGSGRLSIATSVGAQLLTTANAVSDPNSNEADATTGWTGIATTVMKSTSTNSPFAGTYHIQCEGPNGSQLRGATPVLENGAVYKATFALKVASGSVYFAVKFTSTDPLGGGALALDLGEVNVYQEHTVYWQSDRDNYQYIYFRATGDSVFYVDNFSVTKVTGGDLTAYEAKIGSNVIAGGSLVSYAGLKIKEGTNARMGTATLVGGTITVANTSVTANTRIFISRSTTGGTEGHLSTTQVAATSFTVNSSSGTDTSKVNWLLIEPSP